MRQLLLVGKLCGFFPARTFPGGQMEHLCANVEHQEERPAVASGSEPCLPLCLLGSHKALAGTQLQLPNLPSHELRLGIPAAVF